MGEAEEIPRKNSWSLDEHMQTTLNYAFSFFFFFGGVAGIESE